MNEHDKIIINTKSNTIPWRSLLQPLLLFVLVGLMVADYQGWLIPLQDFLDHPALTYRFGKYEVSVYSIVQSLLVVITIFWIVTWVMRWINRRVGRLESIHPSSRSLAQKIIMIVFYIFAFFMTMGTLGIDLSSLTVLGGAVGIGLGFGLQKIASNFISGLILLLERSLQIGDMVEMADGTLGIVRKNGARYTLIETFDNREIMIPNEEFIIGKVINWTFTNKKGRIDLAIGVSYKSDLELAKKLLLEAATEHKMVLKDPEPICFLKGFGDSAVHFMLYVWVADITETMNSVQDEVLFSIWNKFKANNIEFPFPQRDIHIRTSPSSPLA
jgi:small-conductance mechanosensitive channel